MNHPANFLPGEQDGPRPADTQEREMKTSPRTA